MNSNIKQQYSNYIIASDADNTLWDTNAIYIESHLELLEKIEKDTGLKAQTTDRLSFIRSVDQEIVRLNGGNLQYSPVLLYMGVSNLLKGMPLPQAAKKAMEISDKVFHNEPIKNAVSNFKKQISENIPRLRCGVSEGLFGLKKLGVIVIVLTEGREARCSKLLIAHGLEGFVTEVVSGEKGPDFYNKISKDYPNSKLFMVGDQIDRDIISAKKAGYTTIFFPGGFNPKWNKNYVSQSFDFQIKSFKEILNIIANM
jgi:putative hydrolase of the HAD superfamily